MTTWHEADAGGYDESAGFYYNVFFINAMVTRNHHPSLPPTLGSSAGRQRFDAASREKGETLKSEGGIRLHGLTQRTRRAQSSEAATGINAKGKRRKNAEPEFNSEGGKERRGGDGRSSREKAQKVQRGAPHPVAAGNSLAGYERFGLLQCRAAKPQPSSRTWQKGNPPPYLGGDSMGQRPENRSQRPVGQKAESRK
jgi:hypothetical protein